MVRSARVMSYNPARCLMSGDAWFDEGRSFGGRGDIYRWLREHHAVVTEWLAVRQPSWETIASRIARDGVVGQRGNPPAWHSVRRVWQRVCRDVAAEAAAREAAAREAAEREAVHQHYMMTGILVQPRNNQAAAPSAPLAGVSRGSVQPGLAGTSAPVVAPGSGAMATLEGMPRSSLHRGIDPDSETVKRLGAIWRERKKSGAPKPTVDRSLLPMGWTISPYGELENPDERYWRKELEKCGILPMTRE